MPQAHSARENSTPTRRRPPRNGHCVTIRLTVLKPRDVHVYEAQHAVLTRFMSVASDRQAGWLLLHLLLLLLLLHIGSAAETWVHQGLTETFLQTY